MKSHLPQPTLTASYTATSPLPLSLQATSALPHVPSHKCTLGRQNFDLWPSEEVGKCSFQKSIIKLHKLTKAAISTCWKSSKGMQPSKKCSCLKTAALQVEAVSLQPPGCSHSTLPAGETQRLCREGSPWAQQL